MLLMYETLILTLACFEINYFLIYVYFSVTGSVLSYCTTSNYTEISNTYIYGPNHSTFAK